jgi:hypothetical protein
MDISTHFIFQHKVFNVEGGCFSTPKDSDETYFSMSMGDSAAQLTLPALREEFSISDDCDDGKLLRVVESALKYVTVIRVNDSIPNELLDGTASWSVDERHNLISRGRLTLQLIAWVSGRTDKEANMAQILRDLESPAVKEKVKDSLEKLTKQLGLGDGGMEEVERRIDTIVHEMSYIEALRERLATIYNLEKLVKKAASTCSKRRSAIESAERSIALLPYAFTKLGSEFELIDKLNQNFVDILKDVDGSVELTREVRDEIHCTLKIWDDLIASWQAEGSSKDVGVLSSLLGDTHRFLAENYPIMHSW